MSGSSDLETVPASESPDGCAAEWMTEAAFNCPYPLYETLRTEAPVCKYSGDEFTLYGSDVYLVSRWADIAYINEHPELFEMVLGDHGPGYTQRWRPPYPDAPRGKYSPYPLFYTDGLEHRLKRGYAQRLVTREHRERYEPAARAVINQLIDQFIDSGEVELRTQLAISVPGQVASVLAGLPPEDLPKWFLRYRLATEGSLSEEEAARHSHLEGFGYAYKYMEDAVLERYKHPRNDLMSEVIRDHVERDGGLDLNWQIAFWANLLATAAGTSGSLILNFFVHTLRDQPSVMEALRADPSLIKPAVEESLRLEPPVHHLPRIAVVDTEVGGVPIPAGSVLALLYGSGNHDPSVWETPEAFDLDRADVRKKTLSFGRGIHLCVGAPLGRWTGVLTIEELFRRVTNLKLDEARSDLTRTPPEPQLKRVVLTFDRL